MINIAASGDIDTSYIWSLAEPTDHCPNWIARWFLYHKFRYRDGRNKNATRGDGKHHSSHHARHDYSYAEPSYWGQSETQGQETVARMIPGMSSQIGRCPEACISRTSIKKTSSTRNALTVGLKWVSYICNMLPFHIPHILENPADFSDSKFTDCDKL